MCLRPVFGAPARLATFSSGAHPTGGPLGSLFLSLSNSHSLTLSLAHYLSHFSSRTAAHSNLFSWQFGPDVSMAFDASAKGRLAGTASSPNWLASARRRPPVSPSRKPIKRFVLVGAREAGVRAAAAAAAVAAAPLIKSAHKMKI